MSVPPDPNATSVNAGAAGAAGAAGITSSTTSPIAGESTAILGTSATVSSTTLSSSSENSSTATTAHSSTTVPSLSGTNASTTVSKSSGLGESLTATSTAHAESSHSSSSKGNISTGALAGSIVGAFIGGCLIAFIIAFLCFRKRKQKSNHARASYMAASTPKSQGKNLAEPQLGSTVSYATKDATSSPDIFGAAITSQYIPPPADDGTVAMKIQTLFDQIGLHVENYYIRISTNPPREVLDAISHYDSSLAAVSLPSLLSNSKTQRAALTHALAFDILEAIRPGPETGILLPACFRWGPEQSLRGVSDSKQDNAIFNWRMLISHLNSRDYSSHRSSQNNTINTDKLARDFASTFSSYKNPEFSDSERLNHLSSTIEAASKLGIWLFSQPCLFAFDWKAGSTKSTDDQLVIFPAVVKVCDERGRRFEVPTKIVEEKAMKI